MLTPKSVIIIPAIRPLHMPLHPLPIHSNPTHCRTAIQHPVKTSAPLGSPHWPGPSRFRSFLYPLQFPVVSLSLCLSHCTAIVQSCSFLACLLPSVPCTFGKKGISYSASKVMLNSPSQASAVHEPRTFRCSSWI